MFSWTYRDSFRGEPSRSGYLLFRLVSAIGVISLTLGSVGAYQVWQRRQPVPPAPPTLVELMWGKPNPVVLNKVVHGVTQIPTGLVDQPILGYQVVDGQTRQPSYLFGLKHFKLKSATKLNGLVGTGPSAGLVALDTADLVLKVSGDPKCFAQVVVVREDAEKVEVGVYYGQANPSDGSNKDQVANCSTISARENRSTLIPIDLSDEVGKRQVVGLDGRGIFEVKDLTNQG